MIQPDIVVYSCIVAMTDDDDIDNDNDNEMTILMCNIIMAMIMSSFAVHVIFN